MAHKSDKSRILAALKKMGGESTTARIATKAGALHPSTRRCLNELRAEGLVQRGSTHGTWIYVPPTVAEPVEVVDTDTVQLEAGPVPSELDVNERKFFKLEAEGDTVYAEAVNEDDAFGQLQSAVSDEEDPLPRSIVTITAVEEIPFDANVLRDGDIVEYIQNVDSDEGGLDEPSSDDEPKDDVQ